MKFGKIVAALAALMLTLTPFTAFSAPDDDSSADIVVDSALDDAPDVKYAEAAVLMDLDSGRLLYAKNPQERLYPASTTKMMSAIIALEEGNMDDKVVATYEALRDITMEDSHMGILVGEEFTMEQLMNGLLVYSANDAANVIAVHLSGSIEAYVDKMNAKAAQLGMNNTHFSNVCGLHDEDHYTTAEDLAILGKYCMQNETFREIVKKPIYNMPATNKYALERNLPNTNLFLSTSRSSAYYYQPCIGIKTGHTSQAGYCLVSAAEHDGINLLAVVLKCDNKAGTSDGEYSYIDSKTLLEFGFNNYEIASIAHPGEIIYDKSVYEAKNNLRVSLTVPDDVTALIPSGMDTNESIDKEITLPDTLEAPIVKGEALGTVVYSYQGKDLGRVDLVAANDVERNEIIHAFHIVLRVITSPLFFIPVIIIVILLIIANQQKRKRERKRRIQQLKRNKQRKENGADISYRTPDRKASRLQRQGEETRGSTARYKNGRDNT